MEKIEVQNCTTTKPLNQNKMKELMKWIHMVVCLLLTFSLIGIVNSPLITKDEFCGALFVYLYMVVLLIALFKED